MKKILLILGLVLLFLKPSYADSIVLFSTTTNHCLRYIPSTEALPYEGRVDALIFNDTSFQTEEELRVVLSTTPVRYTKKKPTRNAIEHMTQAEKDQVDAELLLARQLAARVQAIKLVDAVSSNPLLMRAIADIVKDEINILRSWDRSLKTAVASSTTLANLKTGIAALPNLPDRTFTDIKTAIINRINSGNVDK